MKFLFIGGYPKGYDVPFHPSTLSGKRLRNIVAELNLDAEYFDLWANLEDERRGWITEDARQKIEKAQSDGVICVALGKWVKKCLWWKVGLNVTYLPHPASRRQIDRETLREGLQFLCEKPMEEK